MQIIVFPEGGSVGLVLAHVEFQSTHAHVVLKLKIDIQRWLRHYQVGFGQAVEGLISATPCPPAAGLFDFQGEDGVDLFYCDGQPCLGDLWEDALPQIWRSPL